MVYHFVCLKGLSLNDDYHLHNFEETTISDIYNYKEMQNKIKQALDKYGLNDLAFEFAIADKKAILK